MAWRRVPVFAHHVLVSGGPANRIVVGHDVRGAQFIDNAPEAEVLQYTLGKILTLGNDLWLKAALNQRACDAAEPKLDRESRADWPALMMNCCLFHQGARLECGLLVVSGGGGGGG
jgi:hypothetical protein